MLEFLNDLGGLQEPSRSSVVTGYIVDSCAGSFELSMGARNRVVVPARQAILACGIDCFESIPLLEF